MLRMLLRDTFCLYVMGENSFRRDDRLQIARFQVYLTNVELDSF